MAGAPASTAIAARRAAPSPARSGRWAVAACAAAADGDRRAGMRGPKFWSVGLAVGVWVALAAAPRAAEEAQQSYASPQAAVDALIAAARAHDPAALAAVFGPASRRLVSSGDRYADEQ